MAGARHRPSHPAKGCNLADPVIDEVLFALQQKRDAYEANGVEREAAQYQRYCDAVQFSRALVLGARLSPDEIETYSRDLMSVTSPYLLEQLLTYSRQQPAYRSLMKLATQVCRVAQGKPPRKLLGIFG